MADRLSRSFRKAAICFVDSIDMTTLTFVKYLRELASGLGIGVTKDKTKFGPSTATPPSQEQKNCGALSSMDIPNLEMFNRPHQQCFANPRPLTVEKQFINKIT